MNKSLFTKFTGHKVRVSPCSCEEHAGKTRGVFCFFNPPGDATSLKTDLERSSQGQLNPFLNPLTYENQTMALSIKKGIHPLPSQLSKILLFGLFLGAVFFPPDLWAHNGDLLKDEIEKLEKLFTGGYMRLGLLGVCGFAAVYGIVKQNGWTFASGILGCVFAYFMKDWITKTFTMVI